MSAGNYLARLRFNKIIGTRGAFIKNFIQSAYAIQGPTTRKPLQFSYCTSCVGFLRRSLQYEFIFKLRIVIFYGNPRAHILLSLLIPPLKCHTYVVILFNRIRKCHNGIIKFQLGRLYNVTK